MTDTDGVVGRRVVVDLDEVTKTFPGSTPVHALRSCDVTIYAGEYVAIEGPSGSGKSTLLNILGLLDAPTTGVYTLDGYPTNQLSDADLTALRAHRIGFVFQAFHLVPYRTVVENVELGALYRRTRRRQRRRAAVRVLKQVGLGHRLWAYPPTLSGGERQRVAIARALLNEPALLLCDEPTGNLDTATTDATLGLLERLHRQGLTIIIITHNPEIAARTQRQLRITDGRLTQTDNPVRLSVRL
jgi:putative ABC transport system ATP-binding protein